MSKTVRAKFVINAVTENGDGSKNIHGHPVHSGSEENKAFNDYTPGGRLELHIAAGKTAQELFKAGKEYYVDITLAE